LVEDVHAKITLPLPTGEDGHYYGIITCLHKTTTKSRYNCFLSLSPSPSRSPLPPFLASSLSPPPYPFLFYRPLIISRHAFILSDISGQQKAEAALSEYRSTLEENVRTRTQELKERYIFISIISIYKPFIYISSLFFALYCYNSYFVF
jgi:hypothetical protein